MQAILLHGTHISHISIFIIIIIWWGCKQRGGAEATAGGRCGSAASEARREITLTALLDGHAPDTDMHTKCCVHELWQTAACEENKERANENAGSPPRPDWSTRAGQCFAAEVIPPELLPMRLSCAWIPPFGLQVQDKTGRCRRLCVVDTVCECTLSVSPHTPLGNSFRMALTICTRFTDEYQLFEELGK